MQPVTKIFKKRLKSTNLYATSLLAQERATTPMWVRAGNQFAGKGQGNHTWISEPGKNLTGTLVVSPEKLSGSDQFILSMTFSLAAADFLGLFSGDIRIKWPNDLYSGDKKIGGILIENAIMGSWVDHAILGIGINVNQTDFPREIPNPVSLKSLNRITYDLVEIEDLLIEAFKNRYQLVESGNLNGIREDYLEKLYRFGEFTDYQTDNKIFRAKITGVNQFGHLILEDEQGLMRSFAFQEVNYLF
jgi:BirA family transcriptional regulator, biotin operon repressor / biotin---[acetyl-CoA-carboxylase] ligase